MLDERWPSDAAEMSSGLRALLEKACPLDVVRAAEARPDGRDPELDERLEAFGVWDLPRTATILAAAAEEIGRALAPVPFPECAPVAAVLGVAGATCGLEGPVPVPPARTVIADAQGDLLLAEVRDPGRRTTAGDLLASPPVGRGRVGGPADADKVKRLSRLLHGARIVGASERALEIGVDFAKRRTQFGKPIGSFQAVAHRLADAALALDGASLLVRKAAWEADHPDGEAGVPSAVFAPMVWAKAVDAGRTCAAAVHQTMGGYGFTLEEDAQLFSRRIRSWTMRLPAPGRELSALARSLLDPAQRDAVRHLWQNDRGVPLPRWAG